MQKVAANCYYLRAKYLPSFAKNTTKTAISCTEYQKIPTTTLDGGDIMVLDYWIGRYLLDLARKRRQLTARFCEMRRREWAKGVK